MNNLIHYFLLPVIGSSFLFGWDGYDYNEGEYIEIEKGNLVRKYKDIEVYHYEDGSYHMRKFKDSTAMNYKPTTMVQVNSTITKCIKKEKRQCLSI